MQFSIQIFFKNQNMTNILGAIQKKQKQVATQIYLELALCPNVRERAVRWEDGLGGMDEEGWGQDLVWGDTWETVWEGAAQDKGEVWLDEERLRWGDTVLAEEARREVRNGVNEKDDLKWAGT